MRQLFSILKAINDVPLVSSRENVFIQKMVEIIQASLPSYSIANIGDNIIGAERGLKNKKIDNLLFAHLDEIGFLAKKQLSETSYKIATSGLVDALAAHGSKVQTVLDDRKYLGIIGNILPHSKQTTDELVVEFSEPVDLPPLWPIQFANEPVFSTNLISKTLDNRLAVSAIIRASMERPMAFALTSGEEEGTQRLNNLINKLPEFVDFNNIIVLDAVPSNQDYYYKQKTMVDEGKLGIIPSEGDGSGNVAPQNLIDEVEKLLKNNNLSYNTVQTHYPDEITDATSLYRMNIDSIAVGYPVRYIHNAMEVVNANTAEMLLKFIQNAQI
jgi:putative aminopeptidase FrvX